MKKLYTLAINRAIVSLVVILYVSVLYGGQAPLKLIITFPARSDTVQFERIRIAGGTEPGAKVFINDEPVRVYGHGAFVTRLALKEGLNTIIIRSVYQERQVSDTLSIFRIPALKSSPIMPTVIDSAFIEPSQDVWLLPGDFLHVACKASPGGTAQFRLSEEMAWLPMIEQKNGSLAGIYRGAVRILPEWADRWLEIKFQVRGTDSLVAERIAPARIRVLPLTTPLIALTVDETPLWTAAIGGTVIGMLPASIRLQIIGKEANRYRVACTQSQAFYINEQDLSLLPLGESIRPAAVSSPTISVSDNWIKLAMAVDRPIPFIVEQSVEPAFLDLTLYNAYQAHPWITFPEEKTEIKNIVWSQPSSEVLRLRIFLHQRQQWGYRVDYSQNTLHLLIRRTPRLAIDSTRPLQGLNIVVDAGHGGNEPGAISPTGMAEKDVNLTISKFLSQLLRNAGANVGLTRTSDTTLTLRHRIQLARKNQAHIFLWMHNNSVGAEADAAAVSGTSTYFTLPQNQKLAWTVYPHLLALGLQPFGRIQSSYYVTRTTDMLVLLVEGAFMSNPLDEQKLMNMTFLRRISQAVCKGVIEFVQCQNNSE